MIKIIRMSLIITFITFGLSACSTLGMDGKTRSDELDKSPCACANNQIWGGKVFKNS